MLTSMLITVYIGICVCSNMPLFYVSLIAILGICKMHGARVCQIRPC